MKNTLCSICCVALISLPALAGHAAPASDDASNYTGATWTSGSNSGTGFTTWTLGTTTTGGGSAGFFIGDSTSGSGNINSSGQSFGMYGNPAASAQNTTNSADAYRGFSAGSLAVGETFSVQIAVNFRNGNKGFDLFSSGTAVFNLNVGGDQYSVNNAASGNGNLFGGAYDAQTVLTLSFTQSSVSGGLWHISRSGGLTGSASGTYSGDPTDFHFYVQNTDAGIDPNNLYFNNLFVAVPEPSTFMAAGIGFAGLLCWNRRRKQS